MRTGSRASRVGVLIAIAVVLLLGLISGTGEEIEGIGAGESAEVTGIRLAQFGVPVAVMGQLMLDAEPLAGTLFFLIYDPLGNNFKEQCGLQQEFLFPEGTVANGAQVSFIQYPNGIVTFNIAPSQFRPGHLYELPFLPEDPPGAGALEFF